jgi:chromosome segregation ATPase
MMTDIKTTIQQKRAEISALESELGTVRSRMAEVIADGDGSGLIQLKNRCSDLPTLIATARIQLVKLEIEADEQRLPELSSAQSKFYEPILAAQKRVQDEQRELANLQYLSVEAHEDLREVKNRLGERRRELSKLIYEATPAAMVHNPSQKIVQV